MKTVGNLDKWISIGANVGVLIGIVFLLIEIRTNTQSNTLGMQAAYTNNFFQINALDVTQDMAEIIHKSTVGESLSPIEEIQLNGYFQMYLSQTNFIRRLYDRGVATEAEFREIYEYLGKIKNNPYFRQFALGLPEGYQRLLLEEDGFEQYVQTRR